MIRLVGLLLACALPPLEACTIFVLTDKDHALFFNNEDWSNPNTRIWFMPGTTNRYGCAFVGFDDGWAQGGLNSKGLAFDWVAGGSNAWRYTPEMRPVRGNPSQRMLESCASLEESIAFYRQHREPGFSTAQLFVADCTGASAILGARDGALSVQRSNQSRGFGYGGETLASFLSRNPKPTISNGVMMMRACLQQGRYPTRYSTGYNLKTLDLYVYDLSSQDAGVELQLLNELSKPAHYYDLPQIHTQLNQPARPLLVNMLRFPFDELRPIPDLEPQLTGRLREILLGAMRGVLHSDDFTPAFWATIQPQTVREELKAFGELISFALVERGTNEEGQPAYLYHVQFAKGRVLQRYVLDQAGRIAQSRTEAVDLFKSDRATSE